ncbi:MAG: hypothetical protein NCW75_05495 [Phycisphaera sp.]|nr:MAG: hypothetical protein NCW75_05495 [Phycisphaera sp.]
MTDHANIDMNTVNIEVPAGMSAADFAKAIKEMILELLDCQPLSQEVKKQAMAAKACLRNPKAWRIKGQKQWPFFTLEMGPIELTRYEDLDDPSKWQCRMIYDWREATGDRCRVTTEVWAESYDPQAAVDDVMKQAREFARTLSSMVNDLDVSVHRTPEELAPRKFSETIIELPQTFDSHQILLALDDINMSHEAWSVGNVLVLWASLRVDWTTVISKLSIIATSAKITESDVASGLRELVQIGVVEIKDRETKVYRIRPGKILALSLSQKRETRP